MKIRLVLFLALIGTGLSVHAAPSKKAKPKNIELNQIAIQNPPAFVSQARVKKILQRVESFLEWDIRKVRVEWYSDAEAFAKSSGLGFEALAYTRSGDNRIYFGPKVTDENFDIVLGHELTHVVLYQKYKTAIPKWLEEGLANFVARRNKIDWAVIQAQDPLPDVTGLLHPDNGATSSAFHYAASTAVMQMIVSKCRVQDLLQLSVGKNLETYLSTFCRIPDVNAEFKKWVQKHQS